MLQLVKRLFSLLQDMEKEIWPFFPETSLSSLQMRFGRLDWRTHGWTRANDRIQALQNAPNMFNEKAFDLISILSVSLVPGNDFPGTEPLQVLSVTIERTKQLSHDDQSCQWIDSVFAGNGICGI